MMWNHAYLTCFLSCLAACLPLASTLSQQCSQVRTPCIKQLIIDQTNNMDPCLAGTHNFECLARTLEQASNFGTCSPAAALTYAQEAYSEAEVYVQYCNNFVIPGFLKLDQCQSEVAACGRLAFQAFVSSTVNQNTDACRQNLSQFSDCMVTGTGNCSNRTKTQQMTSLEVASTVCETTTTPPKTTTTTPPTTTTTTTTTTPRPTTTTTRTTTTPILTFIPTTATTTPPTTTTARPLTSTPRLFDSGDQEASSLPCNLANIRAGALFQPHPTNPYMFWQCTPWGQGFLMSCPSGTQWLQTYLTCVYRHQ